MTAPDRAALVEEMSALVDALSEYDIANHRGKYAKLRDRSIAALQRASDMIVSLDKQLWATDKAYQINKNSWEREFKQRCERDDRIAELETALTAATKAPLPEDVQMVISTMRNRGGGKIGFDDELLDWANLLESLSRALAEAQAKCSALEADVRRLDKLEEILAAGWYLDSWAGRSGYAFFTGCNGESKSKFSAETVRAVLDAALASQPPEDK